MSSANDYSRMGAVTPDTSHDYTAYMEYCKDERNWFKRARGEWIEHDAEREDPSKGSVPM
jgi:hypothetical protein